MAGLALALGQAPFDLWWLGFAGLVAVFWLFRTAITPRSAGWLGWFFGLGYFGLSMAWIVDPFFVEPEVTGWMAPFAVIGMAGGLSVFWAAAFWGGRRVGSALALVALWALLEMARAYILTGFPWGLVGYVFAASPAVFWASMIGPHGLTILALGTAALLASAPRWGLSGAGAVLLALALLVGPSVQAPAQDLTDRPIVRLIQPNAAQHLKWDPEHARTFFFRQIDFSRAGAVPDLIVWPETALPMFLHQADEALDILTEAARGASVALGVQRTEDGKYFNSMILLDEMGSQAALYDKHHLVPFGEYIPLASLFTGIEIGGIAARARNGYSAGPGPMVIDTPLGRALPLICYEAVFPQDVLGTSERPDYLLHVTNDAWFGTWSGPYQHLMQARLRAIETGLPLVRAANTGISTVLDPGGRSLGALPLNTAGFLDLALPLPAQPTLYARTADIPAFLVVLVLLATAMMTARRFRH